MTNVQHRPGVAATVERPSRGATLSQAGGLTKQALAH